VGDLETVLACYAVGAVRAVEPITIGLIHTTWFVDADRPLVLQRLHPKLAGDGIAADYAAITAHLAHQGFPAPELVCTTDGALLADVGEARWRLSTRVPGRTHARVDGLERVDQAARALGRFHRAVADVEHAFLSDHPLHRTEEHLEALRVAATDPRYAAARALVHGEVEAVLTALPEALLPNNLPRRVVHGDPKISNVMFLGDRATGLVDLDTCNRHTVLVDLGDAARSWCRDGKEDERQDFRLDRFEALVQGYAAEGPELTPEEIRALPGAGRTIALELASRFVRDVLEDHYFARDADRYPDRRSHNVARTRGMLHPAADMFAKRPEIERVVRDHLGD